MKYLLKYYKRNLALMLITVFFLFCQAMSELALPKLMSDIIDKGIVAQDLSYIYKTGFAMMVIAAFLCGCSLLVSFLSSRVGAKIGRDIRNDIFERVTSFSNREMEQFSTASLITRSTGDVQQVQMASIMTLRMACFAPVMGAGALIMALRTSPALSWTIALAIGGVLCIMLFAFFVTFPKFKVVQKMVDKLNLIMNERLTGLLVIRAFNTELTEEERFDKANDDLTRLNLFVNRAMSFMMPAMMLIMNLSSVLIVWVGAKLINIGNLEIGQMMAFIQYAMHVIMSFLFITMMFIFIPRALVSAGRIGEVLATKPTILDMPGAAVPAGFAQKGAAIEFRNVSFTYPDAAEKILSGISFTAKPGQTTAFIGSTGSGKSTLINLIPRFYDVTDGAVLINGVNIKDIPQKDLRGIIGYVPQKGVLFSGTIESNLRYGSPDINNEYLEQITEIAQAKDFIFEKPEGMASEIAQGGTNVSGGQKQRLSIARALAKQASIYIFDDSFSALDFKTDAALRAALKKSMTHSTIFIVGQRINTIKNAEQIIVLEEGAIAGIGTHSELLASCGVYREIAESQLSKEEL